MLKWTNSLLFINDVFFMKNDQNVNVKPKHLKLNDKYVHKICYIHFYSIDI